ncbi:N-acetyltransferase family protein [Paenibacillus marinisediminis]
MKSYSIRPVTTEDVPFLWDMLYESMHVSEGQEPFSRDILNDPYISKYMDGWGREGDLGYIAVNDEDQPVGSITARYFTEDNQGFGYVADDVPELGMALLPEYRGCGIGTALMQRLIQELKVQGVKELSLSVAPDNLAAVKLYQRFGFQEVGMVGTSITMVTKL